MPEKDGTGPRGKGPMTGRGSGYCVIPLNTTQEERNYLKNQEKVLREQLQQIEIRLKGTETTSCRSDQGQKLLERMAEEGKMQEKSDKNGIAASLFRRKDNRRD